MLNDNQLTSSDAKEEREREEEWENFKQQYHKTYATQEEEKKRQKIFRENVKGLEERKKNYSPLMKAGITRFYDLTLEEFKQQTTGLGPLRPKTKEEEEKKRVEVTPTLSDYPLSWDWEEKGDVTPVKNEGQCGSTWAISAIDVMESACSIAGYPLIPLSTQMVMDCNHYFEGCSGGLPQVVYDVVLRLGGIESDQSYPYTGPNGTSTCHAEKSKFVHCKLSTYINITTDKSETLFLKYVYKQSPLVVCLEAGQQAFMDYKGGVLTSKDCPGTYADHCVALVGWVNIGGKRVWKVKNQWGTDWGEKGYAYLEMGSNTCGMDSAYACMPVVIPS